MSAMVRVETKDLQKHVAALVKESKDVLVSSSLNAEQCVHHLKIILSFLDTKPVSEHCLLQTTQVAEARQHFRENHFDQWLSFLINNFTVEWFEKIPRGQSIKLVDVFFLQGPPLTSLLALTDAVNNSGLVRT